jgi:hypothetical protein
MDHDPVWGNTQRIQISRRRRHLGRFEFPGAMNDHLYRPDYEHQQVGVPCEEGGCDPKQRIERPIDDDNEPFVVVLRDNYIWGAGNQGTCSGADAALAVAAVTSNASSATTSGASATDPPASTIASGASSGVSSD